MICTYITRNEYVSIQRERKLFILIFDSPEGIIMNKDYEAQKKIYDVNILSIYYLHNPHQKLIFEHLEINPQIYRSVSEIDFEKEESKIFSNYGNIKFFPDAPCKIKEKFLQMNKCAAFYMKDATEEMILEALKKDPYKIKYIEYPNEAMKIKALTLIPSSEIFRCFENPKKEFEDMAIDLNGDLIIDVNNPSNNMKLRAVIQIFGQMRKLLRKYNESDR